MQLFRISGLGKDRGNDAFPAAPKRVQTTSMLGCQPSNNGAAVLGRQVVIRLDATAGECARRKLAADKP
jgi:hypothetical protein